MAGNKDDDLKAFEDDIESAQELAKFIQKTMQNIQENFETTSYRLIRRNILF
jgi:hypothetical protein